MSAKGITGLLIAVIGCGLGFSPGAVATDPAPVGGDDIGTALFQVTLNDLTITRDLVPQLLFDDARVPHSALDELLLQGPDTAWLEYIHQSKPTEPTPAAVSPIQLAAEEQVAVSTVAPPAHQPEPPLITSSHEAPVPIPAESVPVIVVIPDSVPDPGPLGFLGLGLIALALIRKRRKKGHIMPNPAYGV